MDRSDSLPLQDTSGPIDVQAGVKVKPILDCTQFLAPGRAPLTQPIKFTQKFNSENLGKLGTHGAGILTCSDRPERGE